MVSKDIVKVLISYIMLFAIAAIASIGFSLGEAESSREWSSLWYYLRRGLLITVPLLVQGDRRTPFFPQLGWKLQTRWMLFAVCMGICMGFFNKGGFDPRVPQTLPLAFFHTFSMELYFRGYLFQTLDRTVRKTWLALTVSSLLYASYYQTMWTVWIQPPQTKAVMFAMFTMLGLVFSYSYKRSGSFLVNWTMHIFTGLQFRLLLS